MNYTKITQFKISEGLCQIIIVELQLILTQPPITVKWSKE